MSLRFFASPTKLKSYCGGKPMSLTISRALPTASLSEIPSALARIVTVRCRLTRSIWLGPCVSSMRREAGQLHEAGVRRRDLRVSRASAGACGTACRPAARCRTARPLLVARDGLAADQHVAACWRSSRRECPGRWPARDRRPPAARACAARASCRRRADRESASSRCLIWSE